MMYTVTASLPLLILLTKFHTLGLPAIIILSLFSSPLLISLKKYVILAALAAFLVKFPLFFFHLWLPEAHVEAPVAGSIILAALLLKLGAYGIVRLSPTISRESIRGNYILAISLLGGAYVSLLCLRQKDSKVLIAYSSVSHIALVIARLFCGSK